MSHELSNTRQAVLDYAVTHLRQRDESELRVLDLCAAVSISPSVIYAHFRSRQGLVDAALLTILQEEVEKVLDNLRFIADEARQNGNFAKTLYDHITDPANYDMVKKRNGLRIRIFAAALARPSLKKST